MKNDEYINPVEAGKILGVTRQQILKYIYSGILPSNQYSVGGRHRIKKSDVMALYEGRQKKK